MIAIDFQGGAHGNFLEFACNVAAGVSVDGNPFNAAGASHNKIYRSNIIFKAEHYFQSTHPLVADKVISVQITTDDLLPLSQVSLLRAGDYGYHSDELENNTYHKLNNTNYQWVLDKISNSFFTNQIKDSYQAVIDPSWPMITTLNEFNQLPMSIKEECINVHKLKLLELSPDSPDCPRDVLLEFFQIGFEEPNRHGFITEQEKMVYPPDMPVYKFCFNNFYNTDKFVNEIETICNWAKLTFQNKERIIELHNEFLSRQPFKDSKIKCDLIVKQIIANNIDLPKVTLMEEAYINAMLKKNGNERRY